MSARYSAGYCMKAEGAWTKLFLAPMKLPLLELSFLRKMTILDAIFAFFLLLILAANSTSVSYSFILSSNSWKVPGWPK